jgi:hypothetical protein
MITLFACPKPFRGHFGVIQRNAIKSWTLLHPNPEIILVGEDEGVSEVCKELDLVHIADVEENEYGTPLVDSIFQVCQERAKHSVVCYVNSDIILMSNFMAAVATVSCQMPKFLMIGQRWDVEIGKVLDLASGSWETDLDLMRAQTGKLHSESAMDYFVFPRGMYTDIPPLAIGRLAWDNWLVWRARSKSIPVVDATVAVTIVHQNHDYAAGTIERLVDQGLESGNQEDSLGALRRFDGGWVKLGPEAHRNDALVPEDIRQFGMWAATWMLDRQGALRRHPLSLTPAYLKYQLKWVLPIYWPRLGRVIRWLFGVGKALRRNLGQHLFELNA